MFAGAAREAVFSNPEVVKRVNADFVPVALKAALVNRPPDDAEGLLYREIGRSKPAPQGICVVNSAGKVLDWVLTFDDDKSVLAFFGHARERFAEHPGATKPVAAEVYRTFPSQKLKDVADSGTVLPALDRHPDWKRCPAEPPVRPGTVAARLVGRALDRDGKPVADTVRQEHYVEDRFDVDVETQGCLARALAAAGRGPVKLPPGVTRQWVKHAHLGVLDVQPLDNPGGSPGELTRCDFAATKVGSEEGRTVWRVEGESDVFIDRMATAGPGDLHAVRLTWQGFVEMTGARLTRLVLSATGTEKLRFNSARGKDGNEVASLPGGHRVDLAGGVRFGIVGEPADPARVAADAPAPPGVPADAGRQLAEALGPPFLVFRDPVRRDLKLSDEQAKKLDKRFRDTVRQSTEFFQTLGDRTPEDREKGLHAYRDRARESLTAFLHGLLRDEQFRRLRQVMLQREGLFALSNAEVGKELDVTDAQRRQFAEVVAGMQRKIEPLLREAQASGKHEEIRPKAMEVRAEHAARIEALLSDAQRKRWKEMLGEPLDLTD